MPDSIVLIASLKCLLPYTSSFIPGKTGLYNEKTYFSEKSRRIEQFLSGERWPGGVDSVRKTQFQVIHKHVNRMWITLCIKRGAKLRYTQNSKICAQFILRQWG